MGGDATGTESITFAAYAGTAGGTCDAGGCCSMGDEWIKQNGCSFDTYTAAGCSTGTPTSRTYASLLLEEKPCIEMKRLTGCTVASDTASDTDSSDAAVPSSYSALSATVVCMSA